jgi:RNA polymerase sigma-B factor
MTPPDTHGRREEPAGRARVEAMLFERRLRGDARARDELVERFLPLARQLARRYHRGGEPLDDLVQVASLALVKAIDRFEPDRGLAFSSFAVPTIVGELKRHFRDRTWAVRPPRDLQELSLRVERAITELSRNRRRAPSVPELAAVLRVDEEAILEAMEARGANRAASFQAPLAGDEDADTLGDVLGVDEVGFGRAEDRATLTRLMAGITAREREVLRLRFEEDLTQAEIGELVGISQMQVSRLIRQAIARMRASAGAADLALH